MRRFLNFTPTLLAISILAGCSSIPQPSERESLDAMQSDAVSDWDSTPAIVRHQFIKAAEVLTPQQIPHSLYSKQINIELSERVTVDEFAGILSMAGAQVVLATDELEDVSLYVPRFSGEMGVLLDSLSASSELSFTSLRDTLIIDVTAPYLLRVPQNEDIGEAIGEVIGSMGAKEVQVSKEAGMVSYRAASRDQAKITAYLDRIAVNTSMVNLQVAVLNVSLTEEQRKGLDWSSLSLSVGKLGLLDAAADAAADAVDVVTDTATDAAAEATTEVIYGSAAKLSGSGISVIVSEKNVGLEGVLNMLSTYGESKTVQNLVLKTLSGVPVELRSGESIPYVEDVSLNVNESSSTSGVSTTTVETGFEVEINPYYNDEENLVTVELDLSMKSLIGFRELSAGNQIGTISRPQVQDQSLKNIARMAAGETALVGGLIYESVSDNRTGLAGLERYRIGSKALRTQSNAMFILLRPTVVVYGPRNNNQVAAQ